MQIGILIILVKNSKWRPMWLLIKCADEAQLQKRLDEIDNIRKVQIDSRE